MGLGQGADGRIQQKVLQGREVQVHGSSRHLRCVGDLTDRWGPALGEQLDGGIDDGFACASALSFPATAICPRRLDIRHEVYFTTLQSIHICVVKEGERYMGKVVLINRFDVPAGRDKEFLTLWLEVNRHMRSQPGYLEHRLHRGLADSDCGRYVNVATWESAEALHAAHQSEQFRSLTSQPAFREFPNSPATYEIVADTKTEPALS